MLGVVTGGARKRSLARWARASENRERAVIRFPADNSRARTRTHRVAGHRNDTYLKQNERKTGVQ